MNFKYRDLLLAVLCAFLGGVKGYLISQVKSLGAIEIFAIRSLGTLCSILPIIIFFKYQIFYDKKRNLMLALRSLIGNIAVCGYYYGFVNLPIAEASLLFYSTPIFTIIIGHFCLKEYCCFTQIFSTIMSVCGVFVVCIPQFSMDYSMSTVTGVAGCLIGAFAQAVALALIRTITDIPPFIVSFWWALIGIMFSTVLCVSLNEVKTWDCGWEVICLIYISFAGFISEVCLVSSLKSTDAVIISLALTSEIIWAFLLQYFVCHEVPSCMTIIGGIIIAISLLLSPLVQLTDKTSSLKDEKSKV